jgi:hypothetical protein
MVISSIKAILQPYERRSTEAMDALAAWHLKSLTQGPFNVFSNWVFRRC